MAKVNPWSNLMHNHAATLYQMTSQCEPKGATNSGFSNHTPVIWEEGLRLRQDLFQKEENLRRQKREDDTGKHTDCIQNLYEAA